MADALRDHCPRGGNPGRQRRGAGPRRAPAPVKAKGARPRTRRRGAVRKDFVLETVYWDAGTARLLPRLLKGRTRGPVSVTHRKPGPGEVVNPRDICPDTGLARLSYGQAWMLLDEHTALGGELGTGWYLHEWRHSGLTHLGEGGASLLMLMAKSRHKKAENVRKYFHPSPEAITEVTSLLAPGRGGGPVRGMPYDVICDGRAGQWLYAWPSSGQIPVRTRRAEAGVSPQCRVCWAAVTGSERRCRLRAGSPRPACSTGRWTVTGPPGGG